MAEKSVKTWRSVAYSRREFVKTSAGALALAGLRTVRLATTVHHPALRGLYYLSRDPGEFNSLADQPVCKAVVKNLHARMLRELGEQPDETEQRCRRDYARGYGRG